MSDEHKSPGWLGPVLGAVILIGGYVGYQQWHEYHEHQQLCRTLNRQFGNTVNSYMGSGAVRGAIKEGNQALLAGIAGDVESNKVVMQRLDAECPGWRTGGYN